MNQTKRQEDKMAENARNKKKWEGDWYETDIQEKDKSKPKRQNRARERKEREEKSKSEPKVKKLKSTPTKVKVKDGAETEEKVNGQLVPI
ncbi:hypothetical protein Tco_1544513 [Tanacetum coccineum]